MTNKPAVIYLLKDRFHLYSPTLPQVIEFRFTPEVIRDLDVVNIEMLETLIKAFIAATKLPVSDLTFVLADNTYFTKDFVRPDANKKPQPAGTPTTPQPMDVTKEVLKKQADQFVEHVPYDSVVSKTFPLANGIRVVATNKELYESIASAFEHQNFTTAIVLPGIVFGGNFANQAALTRTMATTILQKANSFKQYNLLGQAVYQPLVEESGEVDEVEAEKDTTGKPNKKRLLALTGVFASLIIVLVIVFVQSQNPPTPPQQPAQADNTLPPIVPPTATPIVMDSPATASPSALQTQSLSVKIQSNATNVTTAQDIRAALTQYTFASIVNQTDSTVNSAVTQVSFSSATPTDVRNAILEEIRKFKSNITVQESQQGTIDITINVGN